MEGVGVGPLLGEGEQHGWASNGWDGRDEQDHHQAGRALGAGQLQSATWTSADWMGKVVVEQLL